MFLEQVPSLATRAIRILRLSETESAVDTKWIKYDPVVMTVAVRIYFLYVLPLCYQTPIKTLWFWLIYQIWAETFRSLCPTLPARMCGFGVWFEHSPSLRSTARGQNREGQGVSCCIKFHFFTCVKRYQERSFDAEIRTGQLHSSRVMNIRTKGEGLKCPKSRERNYYDVKCTLIGT